MALVPRNCLYGCFGYALGSKWNKFTRIWQAFSTISWDVQEIDVYAAKTDGLYLCDSSKHALILTLARDICANTGKAGDTCLCVNIQSFANVAPGNFIYVADFSRMMSINWKYFCAAADFGFISHHVYLYYASEGLATVVRNWIDLLARVLQISCKIWPVLTKNNDDAGS